MRRLAFLLRPGWIALALVVVAFAYLCFTVLAPWQLGKNTKTSRENNRIAQSVNADPVPLKNELRPDHSMPEDAEWRRVTATGHYLPDRQVLARLRVVDAKPAYEALTVFQVDDGPAILVNRGYVRPEQGTSVPPIPPAPTGQVTINARLREPEQQSEKSPFLENGQYQVYSIVPVQVSTLLKIPLAGPYLQLSEGQPGGLGRSRCRSSMPAHSCLTGFSGSRSESWHRSDWDTSCSPRSDSAVRQPLPSRPSNPGHRRPPRRGWRTATGGVDATWRALRRRPSHSAPRAKAAPPHAYPRLAGVRRRRAPDALLRRRDSAGGLPAARPGLPRRLPPRRRHSGWGDFVRHASRHAMRPPRNPEERRGQRGSQRGDPGGKHVHQVVQPRCGPTEPQIAGGLVTDHRVEGVGGAIGQDPRDSGERCPDQGPGVRVGGVLRQRFRGGAGDAADIEQVRVAAAQGRQQCASLIDVVVIEMFGHLGTHPDQ